MTVSVSSSPSRIEAAAPGWAGSRCLAIPRSSRSALAASGPDHAARTLRAMKVRSRSGLDLVQTSAARAARNGLRQFRNAAEGLLVAGQLSDRRDVRGVSDHE